MPTDIIKETDTVTFSDNSADDLYPKLLDNLKSIWLENNNNNNNENENKNGNNSILKSSESCNLDYYQNCHAESFIRAVHEYGFIIGAELENVKAKSRRSLMQQMSNHISKNFQSLYGKENNGVRQNYFQIGVRVPSKEHVSEIVGKQGLKIKEIRENTGALIITPGENEDHVFIIEATPQVALDVAKFIEERANEITANRARDNFQKSIIYNAPCRFGYNKSFSTMSTSRLILATGIIEVPKNIVGRIIGTHGSIITTIQKDTGTEIRSPPKDNHLSNNNNKAKFEILVYQKSNSIDIQEAVQRINNAKQLIAHVAMHQMERIRAEESPFSNYRIKNFTIWDNNDGDKSGVERNSLTDKERLLSYQMQSVAWLWTDIDRLEEHMSAEVVLRILEESKKKSKLRPDYGSVDTVNSGIDRFDDISFSPHSPYKQVGSFANGYETNVYSPSMYSDLNSVLKPPASPILSNGNSRESGTDLTFSSSNNYQSVLLSNADVSTIANHFDSSTATAACSAMSLRSTSLSYKSSLLCPTVTDSSITKSYAEHFKIFTTMNNVPSSSVVSTTTGLDGCPATSNHGAIGDHIKKLNNQNKTAQFNKI